MDELLDYFTPGSEFDGDIFLGENMSGVENVLDAPLLTQPQASMLDNLVSTPSTSNNNNNNNNSIMDNSQNIVGPSQPPVQPSNVIKKKKKRC